MAFLGDFGKFFGLGSSEEVLGDVGGAVGGFVGGTKGAIIGQQLGKATGRATSNLAGSTADQPLEQSAVPTGGNDGGAQETSRTGSTTTNIIDVRRNNGMTSQGNLGGLINLLTKTGRALGTPAGSIATGVGTGALLSMGGNGQQKSVLTQSRRNKAKVRQLVNFMGIEGAADFLAQSSGLNVTPNDVVMLLLRTFRNDGAFITKAQVRNLRRTTNRFKSLEKQVKEATSMARTTRRAAPMRRAASTTLIKN
jgi:hypothetical protein